MLLHVPEPHEKISELVKELKKISTFIFLPAPPQKRHLLNNSQLNRAPRLRELHEGVLEPPEFPTPWSPTTDFTHPAGCLF